MPFQPTHGMTDSAEYHTWQNIKRRCRSYPTYINKGITVCPEWYNDFNQFYADMGDKPTPNHTIDRINNDLGYCPDNCRWATMKEQNNNKSNVRNYTIEGITLTLSEWCEEYNISFKSVDARVRRGWDISKALNTPVRKYRG